MWHCLHALNTRSVVSGVPQVEQRSGAGGVGVGVVFPSIASSFESHSMASSSPCAAAFVHHSRANSLD